MPVRPSQLGGNPETKEGTAEQSSELGPPKPPTWPRLRRVPEWVDLGLRVGELDAPGPGRGAACRRVHSQAPPPRTKAEPPEVLTPEEPLPEDVLLESKLLAAEMLPPGSGLPHAKVLG